MASDLSAKTIQTVFEGEGGSYYSWSSAELTILSQSKLGGGKLILQPHGLALPHYADSSKIGYVLQGIGTVGMILSTTSEEKVLKIKKGDVIALPLGVISWWFNPGDSELSVVFLGETSKAHIPGEFTYFLLGGALGIFNGFSTEFVSKAWNLNKEDTKKIVESQTGVLIIKLNEWQNMPKPSKANDEHVVRSIDVALLSVINGGRLAFVTKRVLPLLGEVGFSVASVQLQGNVIFSPKYSLDSALQVIYIVKGSGDVQVVGIDGQNVLDERITAGQLFVVPRFFVVSVIAGGDGMEWISIITTQEPVFGQLCGGHSVWKALSPQVVQASLNITPELEERFRSKMSQ